MFDTDHQTIIQKITYDVAGIISLVFNTSVPFTVGKGGIDGVHYQTNAVMVICKKLGRDRVETSQLFIAELQKRGYLASVSGPGFININLTDEMLVCCAMNKIAHTHNTKTVIIDMCGFNVAKTPHVGHLRSLVIGSCLQRLFKYFGHTVISDAHLGDIGLQMGQVTSAILTRGIDVNTVTPSQLLQIYRDASEDCKNNTAALDAARECTAALQRGDRVVYDTWNTFREISVNDSKRIVSRFGVDIDLWNGESDYLKECERVVHDALETGVAVVSDGAIVVPMDDGSPPLIMVKTDGAYLYGTTDVATLVQRNAPCATAGAGTKPLVLYVVDQRQALHFKQVFAATSKLCSHNAEHIGFGTVNGIDGKPFKTRDGDLVGLESLLDDTIALAKSRIDDADIATSVALAAIKYADLRNDRTSDYVFDPEKFLSFEGKTGPYIQYAGVRCRSILNQVSEYGDVRIIDDYDRELMLVLNRCDDVLLMAYNRRQPHWIAEYAYDVAVAFSKYYHGVRVIGSKDQATRVALVRLVFDKLEMLCGILGFTIPEKM